MGFDCIKDLLWSHGYKLLTATDKRARRFSIAGWRVVMLGMLGMLIQTILIYSLPVQIGDWISYGAGIGWLLALFSGVQFTQNNQSAQRNSDEPAIRDKRLKAAKRWAIAQTVGISIGIYCLFTMLFIL